MIKIWPIYSIMFILVLSAANAMAQQPLPVLRYTPPPNALRGGAGPSEDYSFSGFNASVQVYPFRAFTGDIRQLFQSTLLRDWIDPMHREENVAAQPTFQMINVPGAQVVMTATFVENIVGLPRPHMRMVIVASGRAAIVDASAGTAQGWQMAIPSLNAMAATLRVDSEPAPAPLTSAAGRAVAGLYMGMKPKYMATMYNVTGSGYYTNALHYYLFSPDGRVYRKYDALDVPGGDIGRFDFDAAERNDPGNSGRYTVGGGNLHIEMKGEQPEIIVAPAPRDGTLTINAVLYKRQ
jgi:hypothetical protein